jgi:hypothetical protein
MSVYQCPKCELRFTWKTELDDHCQQDHPQFKHDYPVRKHAPDQHGGAPTSTRGAADTPARGTT